MAEQDELLQAVLDNPDDDAPRFAYANAPAANKMVRTPTGSAIGR